MVGEKEEGRKMEGKNGGWREKKRTMGSWERKQRAACQGRKDHVVRMGCIYVYIREPSKHRPMTAQ